MLAVDGLAYDSHRARVVLFVGSSSDGRPLNETWEWDGTDWTQIHTVASPASEGAITFDPDRGVVVLFDNLGGTWVYDGIHWEQKFPQHSPTARYGSKLVFDSRRHVAIMFGAYGPTRSNETWEWNGNDWTLRTLPQSPEPRSPAMAYDEARGVTVVFGGVGESFYNDTWDYDGNNWVKITTTNSPSARAAIFGTYSLGRHAVVLFGGIPDDTWEYGSVNNIYNFSGFFQPIDNPGPGPNFVFNLMKAGRGVAVKFSLHGNQGLGIFETGYPSSHKINCNTLAPEDTVEETMTVGQSSLSYDPFADQYSYIWKTNPAWAGTCRQFTMRLNDGTDHIADFSFK
jgi:hypothetical protein